MKEDIPPDPDACKWSPGHPFFPRGGGHPASVQELLRATDEYEWFRAVQRIINDLFDAWSKKEPMPVYRPICELERAYIDQLTALIAGGFKSPGKREFSSIRADLHASYIKSSMSRGDVATFMDAVRLIQLMAGLSVDAARKRVEELERRGFIERLPRSAPFGKKGGASLR